MRSRPPCAPRRTTPSRRPRSRPRSASRSSPPPPSAAAAVTEVSAKNHALAVKWDTQGSIELAGPSGKRLRLAAVFEDTVSNIELRFSHVNHLTGADVWKEPELAGSTGNSRCSNCRNFEKALATVTRRPARASLMSCGPIVTVHRSRRPGSGSQVASYTPLQAWSGCHHRNLRR